MQNKVEINDEEEYRSLCRSFEQKLKQTNERDGLSEEGIGLVAESGHKWASDFFQQYGENEIESHYDAALNHEFEKICRQADRDKTMTGSTHYAIGLHTLAMAFEKMGRMREAWRYLAIASGYLELKKDLSMLYNVVLSSTEQKKNQQLTSRARKGGLGKAHKFEPVRQKVIELLEITERPDAGWPKKEMAFKAIDKPLQQFIEERGIELNVSELRARVLRWSRERADIKAAFQRVLAQKK